MFNRLWALCTTKFLSNFNDNAFKSVGILVAVNQIQEEGAQAAVIAFGSMVFMLPFVIFPTVAGWLCDRFPKRQVLIGSKVAELIIMALGMVSLVLIPQVGFAPLFAVLFLMALQSTFLSPAFLGILPEVFDERQLPKANGIFDLVAFLGIILGCGAGGFLVVNVAPTSLLLGAPFVVMAAIGVAAALAIPHTQVPLSADRFGLHLLRNYFRDFRYVTVSRPLFLCVLGNAFFMSIGALILASLVSFGKQELGLTDPQVSMLQVASAIGIGIGCFVAGTFSHEKVEFGLVPIGSLGMTVFFINLYLTHTFPFAIVNTFCIGLFGGFFTLPLIVYIQEKTPADVRGKTMAQTNAVAFWGTLLVSLLMLVLTGGLTAQTPEAADFWTRVRANFLTLTPRELYLGAALVLVLTSAYVFWLLPDFLLRLLVMLLTRFVYKLRVIGREHIPKRGPVMLLANHVTLVDGLLISAATSRHLTFLIHESYYEQPWVRPFAKWARLIPIGSNPKSIQRALDAVKEALCRGEAICIFPEGNLSRDGMMGAFRKGFLKMLPEGQKVPVIPVHLGMLWGSIFSRRYEAVKIRRPKRFPYPAIISFGEPLPPGTTPHQARQAIAELGARAQCTKAPGECTLAEHVVRLAHRRPFTRIIEDSSGTSLTYLALLIRAYVLAGLIRRQAGRDETYIGVMLPPTGTSPVIALAIMLSDRIPIFLNFTASREAVQYAVDQCDIKRIYTSRVFLEKAELPVRDDMMFLEDEAAKLGTGDKLRAVLATLLVPAWLARRRYFPQQGDSTFNTATVLFSSGSTGMPKGAVLTHHNFTSNVNACVRILGLQRSDKILGSLPFFHSFGFMATFWLPLSWGIPVLYHPNPTDSAKLGELIDEKDITIMFATPTFLQGYCRKCKREQLQRLRLVITGAEKLRQNVADKFAKSFDVVPIEGYGTTELSPVVSVNMPESFHDIGNAIGRTGAVGKPLPGVAARIVDAATGDCLDIDQEGVLHIMGPNVMKGYLNEPEKTAAVLKDGWYDTGDMAKIDHDGYITITGRLSRFSKIGGEMVPHIKLEEEIHEVLESKDNLITITAVEDPVRGERIVVLHRELPMSPSEIIAKLRERGLPNLWIPKPADFHPVDQIPLLGSGKLDLRQIRDMANDLTGR